MPNVIIIKDVGVPGPPGPVGPSTNTGSLLVTASVELNTITFTKGDDTTFPITINTGSGNTGNSGFIYATADDQLNTFSKTYLDNLTPSYIITGSIDEPLTYVGEYQIFEIINVSRQLGLTLSTYGDINMTSSINITQDVDLTTGTFFSAPSGSYFSSITFNTTVGNQSIKVYDKIPQPSILEDALFTTSSVIISKNLYVYENLEVFGGITGSLRGTSSFAETASYVINDNPQNNTFPFSGSAIITGSIVAGNTPFNILNNNVLYNQSSSISNASISLEPKSNLVETRLVTPDAKDNTFEFNIPDIFVNTNFILTITNGTSEQNLDYLIGSRLFITGSTDVFNIPNYKYIANIVGWDIQYNNGAEVWEYTIDCISITATSITSTGNNFNDYIRFYSQSGSGIINLQGHVTASNGLLIQSGGLHTVGDTIITGSTRITGSLDVNGQVSASSYLGDGSLLQGVVTNPMSEDLQVNADITVTGSLNIQGSNILNIGNNNYNIKTINIGQLETGSIGSNSSKNDVNNINIFRNLDNTTSSIHTNINLIQRDINYIDPDYIGCINTGSYISFISKNISLSEPSRRYIDLKFHTQPSTSSLAKGFSTDYSGSIYFNITGSVSASTYYGDGSKLNNLYSTPVEFNLQTTSFTASVTMLGDMIEISGSSTINILLPSSIEQPIPTGSQFTVIQTGNQNTTFTTGSGVIILSFGDKKTLSGLNAIASFVKKSDTVYYLFGNLS